MPDAIEAWPSRPYPLGATNEGAGTNFSMFSEVAEQVVSQVKLIAEPWDVGEGGYQVGIFPPLWSEWNGRVPRCRP